MTFDTPSVWILVLLPIVLGVIWWRWTRQSYRGSVVYSSTKHLAIVRRSWALRLRWIVPLLRLSAIAGLIICLARPQLVDERTQIFSEGIAIQLVVDRSGSMRAMDFVIDDERLSRMEAVQRVVAEFVTGGEDLPGRSGDLIGLITFASFTDSVCPLTLDHSYLSEVIKGTRVATEEEGAATAIGDALALAVERMQSIERRTDLIDSGAITSRVMILLTDGEHNAGETEPELAAQMADAFDIRIYTIGVGSDQGWAPIPVKNPITGREQIRRTPVRIDEETLRKIAEQTGGRYFRATNTDSLREIYAEIDALERTEIEQQHYTERQELAVESFALGTTTLPPLLLIVFGMLVIELALSSTRFRRLP